MRGPYPTLSWRRRLAGLCGVIVYGLLHTSSSTEPAVADGDTRTLTFINNHTNESGSFTYFVNGAYDQGALDKLNWFMRDWRLNEQIKMDPHLFDIIWEVYRDSGSNQPIDVLSAYRSPQTNAMLRRRSRQVAERSQHMQGKAIDAHFVDIRPGPIRDIAMRKQEGGVGFYPIGSTPWVHIDSGTVRYWPRMGRSALARLFPDGKTVFIPADGQPMEGYADAKAMIESRGGEVQTATTSNGVFGWLFGGSRGGGADDEEETGGAPVLVGGRGGPPVMAAIGRGAPASVTVASAQPIGSPDAISPVAADVSAEQKDQAPASGEAAPISSVDVVDTSDPPFPPRKPLELIVPLEGAPVPPKRPAEFAIMSPDDPNSAGKELISRMLEPGALPGAIANGIHVAPKDALALADPAGGGDGSFELLARAAALTPPPLPPRRPKFEAARATSVDQTPPEPPKRPTKTSASSANPWGSLVVDAFNTSSVPPDSRSEQRSATH